jgi:type I restriction enzyme M protein
LLAALPTLETELEELETQPFAMWKASPDGDHAFFGPLLGLGTDKAALRTATATAKKAYTDRARELKRSIKELARLQAERDQQEAEVAAEFEREITHIRDAAADLIRICSDPNEASRYFTVAERPEIVENEFNLNLPRYVDIFDPEEDIPLDAAMEDFLRSRAASQDAEQELLGMLKGTSLEEDVAAHL